MHTSLFTSTPARTAGEDIRSTRGFGDRARQALAAFSPVAPDADQPGMAEALAFANLARLRIIALAILVSQPLLVLADAGNFGTNANQLPTWAGWGVLAFRGGLALASAVLLLATASVTAPPQLGARHRQGQVAYVLFCLTVAALWTGLKAPVSITIYLLAVFAAAAFLHLRWRTSAFVYGLAWAAFAGAVLFSQPEAPAAMPNLINGSILTVLAFAVSRVTYANEARDFHNRELIEQQRQDLEQANRQLAETNAKLERLSFIDPLTEVPNRRYLDEYLRREWRRAQRDGAALTLLVVDVDHFKQFNDSYGHQAGDECLIRVVAALGAVLQRPADMLARFGGDEFVAVLPDTDLQGGRDLGEALLGAVRDLQVPHTGAPHGCVTVSVGIACRRPQRDEPSDALFAAADAALYAAKAAGRARCLASG